MSSCINLLPERQLGNYHSLNPPVSCHDHKARLSFPHLKEPPWPNLPTILIRSNPLDNLSLARLGVVLENPVSGKPIPGGETLVTVRARG